MHDHRLRRLALAVGALAAAAVAATILLLPKPEPATASGAGAIAAGSNHTCAVMFDGGVKCWGYNLYGQLGDDSSTNRSSPVDVCADDACVLNLSGIATVGGGGFHTCAVTAAGGVKCWGNNDFGELGDGTSGDGNQTTPDNIRTTPIDVCADAACTASLTGIAPDVDGGSTQTCARTTAGGVKCWGLNTVGQLGDGTTTQRTTPVDVCASGFGSGCSGGSVLSGVTAINVGSTHTCALTSAGGVKCWGGNSFGQLGNGTASLGSTNPVDVCATGASAPCGGQLLTNVIAISVSGSHSCALLDNGGVKCWGNNEHGELGDGTQGDGNTATADNISTTPVDVCNTGASAPCGGDLLSNVIAVTAGSRHTCAVTSGNTVKCWGNNEFGQVGDGTNGDLDLNTADNVRTTPIDVCADAACAGVLSGVADLAAGDFHSCSRSGGGAVKCWGRNVLSQLGDGTTMLRNTPVAVVGLATDKPPTATPTHTATFTPTPTPTVTNTPTPTPTSTPTPKPSPTAKPTETPNDSANGASLKVDGDCIDQGQPDYALMPGTFTVCVFADIPAARGYRVRVEWPDSILTLQELGNPANYDFFVENCNPPQGAIIEEVADEPAFFEIRVRGPAAAAACQAKIVELTFSCDQQASTTVTMVGPGVDSYWIDSTDAANKPNLKAAQVTCLHAAVDSDRDGCTNQQELGSNQLQGGRRNPLNPWDYMNPTKDRINRVDDILAVVLQYFQDDTDATPGQPPYTAGYNPQTDRTLVGPNLWNLGPPNGQQRVDDILHAVNHYFHDCA